MERYFNRTETKHRHIVLVVFVVMMMLLCISTLTNVNFDPDRFSIMIKQAVDYREQMKELYEAECKRGGKSPCHFSQSEATWMPASDVWDGPTEQLETEGTARLVNR